MLDSAVRGRRIAVMLVPQRASPRDAAAPTGGKVRRRRPPNPAEQAKRQAWGQFWGQITRQIGTEIRKERES